jgi:hypothetical protein
MAGTITRKTKGKAKERPKDMQLTWTNQRRELVPLVAGGYLTHRLSNVTGMQIVRFNNNNMSKNKHLSPMHPFSL